MTTDRKKYKQQKFISSWGRKMESPGMWYWHLVKAFVLHHDMVEGKRESV
jgi:hypothetical protein